MRRFCGLAVALSAAWLGLGGATAQAQRVGKPAPDFSATVLDGPKISLADFKGQVLVVNLWATWCGPCKQELPVLDAYYRQHRGSGLRVIALATLDSVQPHALRPLAKALAIPLVTDLRTGGFFNPGYRELDGVPTNYVIDRKGVVRYAAAAAFTPESLDRILAPLLAEAAPDAAVSTASR